MIELGSAMMAWASLLLELGGSNWIGLDFGSLSSAPA